MRKHTISVIVENEFGALTRIAGLFSGRGYNIESLSAAPTLDETLSRMTIVTTGNDHIIEQIIKHLNKLVNVIKVQDVTSENPVNRALAMIKVNLGEKNQLKLRGLVARHQGSIIYFDDRCSIVQVVAEEDKLKEVIEILRPHGIMEFVTTGNLAIQRGKKVI